MNDTRRGRGRGRSRGGRQHQTEESLTVKPSSDHNSTEIDTSRGVESPNTASSSKPSLRSTDGVNSNHSGRRGRRPHNRNRRKHGLVEKLEVGLVEDEVESLNSEVRDVVIGQDGGDEGRKIEVVRREEEVDGRLGEERKVEEVGGEAEGSELVVKNGDEIRSRLEMLRLSWQEVELSVDQFSVNDQLQEDELLALESIYGDNALNLESMGGLRTFQIQIHLEPPGEFRLKTKLDSSMAGSDNDSYLLKVQYLPPIVLTCLLPKSYPSHLPPIFVISVKWLDSAKIYALCSMLDTIWKEQSGQEVIYHWAEWLQNSSLPYLGIGMDIVIDPSKVCPSKDKRAISGIISPNVDVQFLKNYNDERCHDSFLQSSHQCCICFSEYPGTEFAKLPCRHYFCWTCLKTYSDITVKEGTVNKLKCPTAKCGGMIPPDFLKKLLSEEDFERWESLTLQKSLDSMSDVSYCPRCETACIADEDDFAHCFKCFYSFCSLCMEKRHVGIKCMTPELKLQILQDRQNSSLLREDQKQRERDKINEILSVKEILRDAKQCPSCNMAISRTEGCNKMVCNNCGQYFCYRCGKAIDGYDHFKEGSCNLFTEQMVQEWEHRLNNRQELGQGRVELYPGRAHGCPNCRQLNVKVGNNNHMFCWACQMHYCYLCNKIVRRSAEHYKPKGCKQHTEG
ncbi:unnamed protein product [Rhodiola kirilowii]